MDFQQLLTKMRQIEGTTTSEECGMMTAPSMPPSMPTKPETPPPSMSVNLNAQGMDNIEQMMKLFQKVNPDMMTKSTNIMPSPMQILPDLDADNDMKIGGEMDIEIEPMGKKSKDFISMGLGKNRDKGSQPGGLGASLDRDGDGDHDMDDHGLELKNKKEAWANEPDEQEQDVDYMVNKLAGGMNKRHGTYPKVAGGDNPMQKITHMGENDLRARIRADLQQRLAEAKGAK